MIRNLKKIMFGYILISSIMQFGAFANIDDKVKEGKHLLLKV